MKRLSREGIFVLVISVLALIVLSTTVRPLSAGMWDSIEARYLLYSLPGKGQFVPSPSRADTKNPNFPLEVVNDGYKMIRVYQDLMEHDLVEWAWLVTLRNKTARETVFSVEYKLQDDDAFLLASSREQGRKIAPGETLTLEKRDSMPYANAKRVTASKLDIQFQ
jgi:hypothetical protein